MLYNIFSRGLKYEKFFSNGKHFTDPRDTFLEHERKCTYYKTVSPSSGKDGSPSTPLLETPGLRLLVCLQGLFFPRAIFKILRRKNIAKMISVQHVCSFPYTSPPEIRQQEITEDHCPVFHILTSYDSHFQWNTILYPQLQTVR